MNVIEATDEKDRRAAFALRYQVYRQQEEEYPGMDHQNGLIVDAVDELVTINAAATDKIVTASENSECLFGVSEGMLDVMAGDDVVETLHSGDTFGEIGFAADMPSPVTIRARTDCRLMVLTRRDLAKLEKHHPLLAHRLLLNLFKILSARFRGACVRSAR